MQFFFRWWTEIRYLRNALEVRESRRDYVSVDLRFLEGMRIRIRQKLSRHGVKEPSGYRDARRRPFLKRRPKSEGGVFDNSVVTPARFGEE